MIIECGMCGAPLEPGEAYQEHRENDCPWGPYFGPEEA